MCWLTLGDAPSQYLFAQLRAKHAHDTLCNIQRLDGTHCSTDKAKLAEVTQFYITLFASDPQAVANASQHQQILQFLQPTLSQHDNSLLSHVPSKDKVRSMVFKFKCEKGSRIRRGHCRNVTRMLGFHAHYMLGDGVCLLVRFPPLHPSLYSHY